MNIARRLRSRQGSAEKYHKLAKNSSFTAITREGNKKKETKSPELTTQLQISSTGRLETMLHKLHGRLQVEG